MSKQSDGTPIDPASIEPLLAALDDADVEIRIGALWALLGVPHSAATWGSIGTRANAILLDHAGRTRDELCSVIAAGPWIPVASTRELVARFARGALATDSAVRDTARSALGRIARSPTDHPSANARDHVGFSVFTSEERRALNDELSDCSVDALWAELRRDLAVVLSERRLAFVVTSLMEHAGRAGDLGAGYDVTRWVQERGAPFAPDLEGLFAEFVRLRRAPNSPELFAARQVAWLLSRGGAEPLMAALQEHVRSTDRSERLAAVSAMQYAAAFPPEHPPPEYWVGVAAEPAFQEPALPPRTDLVDEPPEPDELQVDDDVQFTVYRPSAVTPDVWHPFVAFAHRSEPIVLADGRTMRPLEEVEQRAAQLLFDLPSAYESVRTDSDAGLPRGTDLLFEPWVESGAFNPPRQSLRWEEAVHEVHFRLRVPTSADGSRLRGGMRVFAGAVVIGELTFRVPVSSEQTAVAAATERDTTRRFRQIFASYSHRDVAVVEAVERYVSATGDRYLIDSESLRSGEVWDERLCRLIDEADIFQLFWSTNAMNSPFVRREWEYALQLGREGFVRPVFWQEPLAADPHRDLPPRELRRLHFSRLQVAPSPQSGIVCRQCGYLNAADDAFCGSCGSFLEWTGEKVGEPAPSPARPSTPLLERVRVAIATAEPGDASPPPPPPPPPSAAPAGPQAPPKSKPSAPPAGSRAHAPAPMMPTASAKRVQPVRQPPSRTIVPGDRICGECGEGNPAQRTFCSRCGSSLASAVVAKPVRWPRLRPRRKHTHLEAGSRPWRDTDASPKARGQGGLARSWRLLAVVVFAAALVAVLFAVL